MLNNKTENKQKVYKFFHSYFFIKHTIIIKNYRIAHGYN